MEIVIITSMVVKIVMALIALGTLRLALRMFDKSLCKSFSDWLGELDGTGTGIYLGCRILGVCILFGLVISS